MVTEMLDKKCISFFDCALGRYRMKTSSIVAPVHWEKNVTSGSPVFVIFTIKISNKTKYKTQRKTAEAYSFLERTNVAVT